MKIIDCTPIIKYLKNDKDLFDVAIKSKFKKVYSNYCYIYKDDNYTSKEIYNLLESVLYNTYNITFKHKKTHYNIFDITKHFSRIESIIQNRNIYKVISSSNEIIKDKYVYYINNQISRDSLYKIFDIYSGVIEKNCYVIFIVDDKKFALSKSFCNFTYKRNEKGIMCLDINHECWEY